MFEVKEGNQRIKVWLGSEADLPDNCKAQALKLLHLPSVYKWVCLMPDTHVGKGMPIGGVLATKDIVVPEAVGVDIGCGMNFVSTNIKLAEMNKIHTDNGTLVQAIIGRIMRTVPVGREKHLKKMPCDVIDGVYDNPEEYMDVPELFKVLEDGYYQIGTLGGGNHFIELQEDEEGYLCIMIHSGSRHIGSAVCGYFDKIALEENQKEEGTSDIKDVLPYLYCDSPAGKAYIKWMHLAMEYAFENRHRMMTDVKQCVKETLKKFLHKEVVFSEDINCHHNYAALEEHDGEKVWVHRKGAIKAMPGELAVIPGAMGSYSYVVEGKGNKESFCSASHGAGRTYSRMAAMEKFTAQQVIEDLKEKGVTLGAKKKYKVAEECRFAYKDIEEVMRQQEDLVTPIKRLKTVGVIKG